MRQTDENSLANSTLKVGHHAIRVAFWAPQVRREFLGSGGRAMSIADGKSQVRQCLGFRLADS